MSSNPQNTGSEEQQKDTKLSFHSILQEKHVCSTFDALIL